MPRRSRHGRSRSRSHRGGQGSSRRRGQSHARRTLRRQGREILSFGRHQGSTYSEVRRQEPGYVRWALSVPNPGGSLRRFASWLRRSARQAASDGAAEASDGEAEAGEESSGGSSFDLCESESSENGDSPLPMNLMASLGLALGEEVASRGQEPSAARPLPGAELRVLLAQLPRLEYSKELFSGTPYPDSCPICMEDWQDVATGIVLTPCLHVFHETCLGGWFAQHRHCPSCRWDVTDAGEQKALDCSRQMQAPSLGALGGVMVEVSDSE
mmetsp:Transcript_46029/g.133389  ORF Transcript_46029/g.133389 Transcript_46029/m.133389 type:complete len:270 (-) Transcript_46029:120-929(-)